MNNKNPFAIEKLRARLAEKKNYKKLQETYSSKSPEIKDLNTPKLWDDLHFKNTTADQTHPMAADRLQLVSSFIKGKNISVLDIGFGSASLERVFFKQKLSRNVMWQGIEISPLSVKKAKKEFPESTFKIGDILKLAYPENKFDYVISLEVLEHIRPRDTFKALHEIYRVIKPGKYFIVSVPMNEGLEDMIAQERNPNAHVRTYTPEIIKAELEIVGFSIQKEEKLFAFHTFYKLKSFIAKYLFQKQFTYNNVIIVAQKPLI